jgi:ribosomal protein S18 acetylase RimI-like enzyme
MSYASIQIDFTKEEDAATILDVTRRVKVFDAEEVATVDELLGEYFTKGAETSGYYFLSCRDPKNLLGFACFGPRPLTRGTFDFYWLVTDPQVQRHGIGEMLLQKVIQEVKKLGGYLLIIETSGKADYLPARRLYEKYHFERAAMIPDFYSPGDDLFMYVLRL